MTQRIIPLLIFITVAAWLPHAVLAHRSGCHTLHTCPSDSNTYVCGDLGYPCDGSTSINDVSLSAIHVPLLVEKAFTDTFGRKPSESESAYWKKRFRAEKDSVHKIRRTMAWHRMNGSFGPPKAESAKADLVANMNAMFRSVYDGRDPLLSEHQYWISRIQDKPSEPALIGAMTYHKHHGIQH
ncbi:MAG: hypothetical protein WD200_02130 [Candidatus Andersenbacteria bacterium]